MKKQCKKGLNGVAGNRPARGDEVGPVGVVPANRVIDPGCHGATLIAGALWHGKIYACIAAA